MVILTKRTPSFQQAAGFHSPQRHSWAVAFFLPYLLISPNASVSVQNPWAFHAHISHVAAGFLSPMQFCFICNIRSLGSVPDFFCNNLDYGLHKRFLLWEGCFLTKFYPFSSLSSSSVSLTSSLPSATATENGYPEISQEF